MDSISMYFIQQFKEPKTNKKSCSTGLSKKFAVEIVLNFPEFDYFKS